MKTLPGAVGAWTTPALGGGWGEEAGGSEKSLGQACLPLPSSSGGPQFPPLSQGPAKGGEGAYLNHLVEWQLHC
ncbi:hypothetical protein P7K49_014796, partial [Saguinus oedipus]